MSKVKRNKIKCDKTLLKRNYGHFYGHKKTIKSLYFIVNNLISCVNILRLEHITGSITRIDRR